MCFNRLGGGNIDGIEGGLFAFSVAGEVAAEFVRNDSAKVSVTYGADGLVVSFNTRVDHRYSLQVSSDLNVWIEGDAPVTGTGERGEIRIEGDALPDSGATQFLRVVERPLTP